MTGWDILNTLMTAFPPVAAGLLLSGATIMFIVGFGKHGVDFIKHGFKQNVLGDLLDKLATKEDISGLRTEFRVDIGRLDAKIDTVRTEFKADINRLDAKIGADIDRLDAKIGADINRLDAKIGADIGRLDAKFETIEVNHFGHLKDFLTELTSILHDKNIITDTDKTRLNNHLRGM